MRRVIVLLGVLSSIYGFIEQYKPNMAAVIVKELKASTVTLSDVKVYVRADSNDKWQDPKEYFQRREMDSSSSSSDYHRDIRVEMSIFSAPTRDWKSLTKVGVDSYISKSTQYGSKVNFLWTSDSENYYMFLFRAFIEPNVGFDIGIDVVTYEGRPEDPSIYSHTDSQIKNKEKRIAECINVSKEILDLQDLDKLDEEKYTKLSSGIFHVILLAIFLKIGVFIGSFLFINKKIQRFYIDKKIVVRS